MKMLKTFIFYLDNHKIMFYICTIQQTKESFVNTAIVTCVELDENVYVGGVLVIDSDGFPLEFKHSNKITVTKVQKTLYGDSLLTYICQKLLKNKLINS